MFTIIFIFCRATLLGIQHEGISMDPKLRYGPHFRRVYFPSLHAFLNHPLYNPNQRCVPLSSVLRCCTFAPHEGTNKVWSQMDHCRSHFTLSVCLHLNIWGVLCLPIFTHRAHYCPNFGAHLLQSHGLS